MTTITKILATFALYWHFTLDTILTHVFVIACLQAGFSISAALCMSFDSLLKITLSIFISHIIIRISPSMRGKGSMMLKLVMIGIWFVAINQMPIDKLSIIVFIPFLIFKLVLLFDSFMSAEFIFILQEYFSSDLSQSAAAQNILVRASTAIAPALALTLLFLPHMRLVAFIFAMILSVSSLFFLRKIFLLSSNTPFPINHQKPFSLRKIIENPMMRWGLIYQIAGNLAFSGVAFLFLSELKPHSHIFLNEITALYSAFLIAQCVVLVLGEDSVPVNEPVHIAPIMGLCGILVFIASVSQPGIARLIVCLLIGSTYSFSLSAVQKIITSQLRGPGYIEYAGWAQT